MRAHRARGFTLVEVMVAVLVLALGVIGGAAMQLTAQQTRYQSGLLSNALQLASGMADRMRANAEQMRQGDGANPYLDLDYDAVTEPHPAIPAVLCFAPASCSSAQLASFDIYELKQRVTATLPGGRFVICRDAQVADDGRLNWSCSGADGAPIVIKLGWRGADGSAAPDGARAYPPAVSLTLTGAPK